MKVTLLDYTGHGHDDEFYAANLMIFTKNTRIKMSPDGLSEIASWPESKKYEELEYMANTIRSSWEMIDYTFLLEDVTRAFTHQLVRTRHASYAMQTQQILRIDPSAVEPPRGELTDEQRATWNGAVDKMASGYHAMLDMGMTVEQARGILPTNIRTNIVMKANLRTYSEVFGARIGPRNLGEYSEVARLMREAILSVHPWASIFLTADRHKTMETMDRELLDLRSREPETATRLLKLVDQLRREG